jgi:large subunit ribosomal protein LP1
VLGLAMAVFTFVVKCTSGTWTAKQTGGQSSLEDSASNTWELQRKLTNLALTAAGSGVVSSSFSFVTPNSAVAQVIVGGGAGGAVFSGGATAPSAAAGAAAAAAEEKIEEKKEEKEESDDDMGFSLFD